MSADVGQAVVGSPGLPAASGLHLGFVAGEPSGDMIAAELMAGVRAVEPQARCTGIGGPRMRAQGLETWHDMDPLSVFGYWDALRRLPQLIGIRNDVRRRWLRQRPDAFIGVDAPDFNLGLSLALRQAGVPTVQFVGPSIWAWRRERIELIRRAVSHILVIFPFEVPIYEAAGIPVTYVGHPLARRIPLQPDRAAARQRLGVALDATVLAVLPGSRSGEIAQLGERFLAAARLVRAKRGPMQVLVPMVNPTRQAQFERMLTPEDRTWMRCVQGGAYDVMEACDSALVASGTASLELALFKRPMVIAYALPALALRFMQWKARQKTPYVPWVGLPNVLAGEFVVPELLQDAATPRALADAALAQLAGGPAVSALEARFLAMHESLLRDTPQLSSAAVLEVVRHGAR